MLGQKYCHTTSPDTDRENDYAAILLCFHVDPHSEQLWGGKVLKLLWLHDGATSRSPKLVFSRTVSVNVVHQRLITWVADLSCNLGRSHIFNALPKLEWF